MGNNTPDPHYLIDGNNTKISTPEEKEHLHRELWCKIFTEDEEYEGDEETEAEVRNYLNNNQHRITPFDTADSERLNPELHFTSPITTSEILTIIKKMKKTIAG